MWAKLDLQLGPADGRRPGPPEAETRVGAELWNHRAHPHLLPQHRPAYWKGPAARARDVRRPQEWLEKQQEPVLELPARQAAQEDDPQIQTDQADSSPVQEDQEIMVTSKAVQITSNELEVGTSNSDPDIDFIPQLVGPGDVKLAELSIEKTTLEEKALCPICLKNSGYCHCGSCDKCIYFATERGFSIHMMNDHEPNEVVQHFGMDWIKDNFQHIHRNFIDEKSKETRI